MSASFIHRDPLALNQNSLHILNGSKAPGSTCSSTQHDFYSISTGSASVNTSRSHLLDRSIPSDTIKTETVIESHCQQQQRQHRHPPIQSPKMSPDSTLTHLPTPISSSSAVSCLSTSSSISARTTPNSPGQQANVNSCGVVVGTGNGDAYFRSALFQLESIEDKQRCVVGSSTTGLDQSSDVTNRQQQHFHYYHQQHPSYQPNSSPTSIMRPRSMTASNASRCDTPINNAGYAVHTSPTAPSSTTTPVKKSSRRNPWGSETYSDLISIAIHSYPDEQATLQQIYDFIITHYEYFRQRSDATSSAGWKNSIRHNLSLHDRFTKCPKSSDNSKSSYWRINPDVALKPYVRRRACSIDTGSLKRPSNLQHHHSNKISSMTNRTSLMNGGIGGTMTGNINTGSALASTTVPSSTVQSVGGTAEVGRQQPSNLPTLCELECPPATSDTSTSVLRTPTNAGDRNQPAYDCSMINVCGNKTVDYARPSSMYHGVLPTHDHPHAPQHTICNGKARWFGPMNSTTKCSSDMTLLTDGRTSFSGHLYPACSLSSERHFSSHHNSSSSSSCDYRMPSYGSTDQSNTAKFSGSGGLIEQLLRTDATLKLHPHYTSSVKSSKGNLDSLLDRNGVNTYVPNSFQAVVSQPPPIVHDASRMPSKNTSSRLRPTLQHPFLFNTNNLSGHDTAVDMKTQSSFNDPSESSISHHLQPVPLNQQHQASENSNASISSALTTLVDWSSTNSPGTGYVSSLKQTYPSISTYPSDSDGLRSKPGVMIDHDHRQRTDPFVPFLTNTSDGHYSQVTSSWSRALGESETHKPSTLTDCRLLGLNTPPDPIHQHPVPATFFGHPRESSIHHQQASTYAADPLHSTCGGHTASLSLVPYEDSYLYDDCEPLELELSLELADRIVGSTRTTVALN